jgi:retron-type reverse transcriptase
MGFWDKIKSAFGAGPAPSTPPAEDDLPARVVATIRRKLDAREPFRVGDIAQETAGGTADRAAYATVWRVVREQMAAIEGRGYAHTVFSGAREVHLFHPPGVDARAWLAAQDPDEMAAAFASAPAATAPRAPTPATTAPRPQPQPPSQPPPRAPVGAAAPAPAPAPPPPSVDRYRSDITALDAAQLRERALRITPWRTPWIGRTDTIPPASDERTAIIDRGLRLRGFLTEAQLAEIHRVGDLWLRHHDAVRLAGIAAHASAEAALAEEKQRKAERKLAKQREAAERARRRAEAVAERRKSDIIFLGRGVSAGLADRRANLERLAAQGLPVLVTPADVAAALGIPVPRLRWLCHHNEAATRIHYVYFEVPKRSGGTRLLSAPHQQLGAAQQWIFEHVLSKLPTEAPAHGFVRGRSTVSNATPHLGQDVVVNLDLRDFFPSISWRRVRGLFAHLGYSPAAATVLALLCTEAPRRAVELDGRRFWVAVGERALPQGACTSPALSNQIARALDKRLDGMARKDGWRYTRYADDLTFSAPDAGQVNVGLLLARVRHIAEDEGFAVNEAKGRVQRASSRQTVTGVVVNDKPGLPRQEVRRLRAILHGARKHGLASQNRDGHPHFESWLRGKLAYLQMIDRARGSAMLAELDRIVAG